MFSLARDLHTPVGSMLRGMSQSELCHWIAYHKLENAKEDTRKKAAVEDEQAKKDAALKSMLMKHWGPKAQRK